jgi:hypothetical protein
MDRVFVDEYWTGHFEFYDDNMQPAAGYDEVTQVRIKEKNLVLPRKEFLSDEYYYGDYTRLLPYVTDKYGLKEIFEGHDLEFISSKLESVSCSVIEEVRDSDYKTYIMGMLENIYKTVPDGKIPELRVFSWTEIENLIYKTSCYYERLFVLNNNS